MFLFACGFIYYVCEVPQIIISGDWAIRESTNEGLRTSAPPTTSSDQWIAENQSGQHPDSAGIHLLALQLTDTRTSLLATHLASSSRNSTSPQPRSRNLLALHQQQQHLRHSPRLLGPAGPQRHPFFGLLKSQARCSSERNPSWCDSPTRAPSPTGLGTLCVYLLRPAVRTRTCCSDPWRYFGLKRVWDLMSQNLARSPVCEEQIHWAPLHRKLQQSSASLWT